MVLMKNPSWFKENHYTSTNQETLDDVYRGRILNAISKDNSDLKELLPTPSSSEKQMVVFLETLCENMYQYEINFNQDFDSCDILIDNLISTIAELTNIDMIEYLKNISEESLSSVFDIMYLLLMMAKSPFVVRNYANAEIRYFSSVVGEVLETFDRYDNNGVDNSFIIHKVLLDDKLSWIPDPRCTQETYGAKHAGIFKIAENFMYNGLDNNRCIRRTCTRIINKYFGM